MSDPLTGIVQFDERSLKAAIAHAAAGGQALHLMRGHFAYMRASTPKCFHGRNVIAHLFDQSLPRLVATAKRLGVRIIKVERESTPGQPLERALAACPAPAPSNLLLFPNP